MAKIKGWIFDGYLVSGGVSLWIIDESGRMQTAFDPWQPRLFVKPSPRLASFLSRQKTPLTTRRTERKEFYTLKSIPVLEIRVHDPLLYNRFVMELEAMEGLELYNCDLHLIQAWHYERKHFPLAKGIFETDPHGVLTRFELRDSPWDIDYELPPLRYLRMGLEGRTTDPNHSGVLPLSLKLGNSPQETTSYVLETMDPKEQIEALNRHIAEFDPDVILSDWGDSYIFPRLTLLAQKVNV